MRIGIISDSHHDKAGIEKAMMRMGAIDHLIHAGDHLSDAKHIAQKYGVSITAVKGNMDMGAGHSEVIVEMEGHRILVTHGHKYHVKRGYQQIYYKALESDVDIVVFGHTHVAMQFEESNIMFINPGSVSHPYGGHAKSFAILEMQEQKYQVEIQYFD